MARAKFLSEGLGQFDVLHVRLMRISVLQCWSEGLMSRYLSC
ncbi:hypothetical protein ATI45_3265 [Marinobacter sp. LV10MA510-1]|nr:hypothetical protein ATI45_3265 [Marinobacter sp. LV10MA510-1]